MKIILSDAWCWKNIIKPASSHYSEKIEIIWGSKQWRQNDGSYVDVSMTFDLSNGWHPVRNARTILQS